MEPGRINSLESISGLLKSLQIRALKVKIKNQIFDLSDPFYELVNFEFSCDFVGILIIPCWNPRYREVDCSNQVCDTGEFDSPPRVGAMEVYDEKT